jgi:hypothetical protein
MYRCTNQISLCTCEMVAENGAFGGCFRHPFHHTPTRTSGRFNLFLGSSAPSAQRVSTVESLLTFSTSTLTHSPSPPPPPSSEGPILAPRALSPKWTPLHLPCASWLAVYIGLYQLAFALVSQSIVALKAQASTLFSAGRTLQVMNALPSRPRPVPPRPHWTEPVSREETLARREKFQKIGWLPPNHKPKTKKVIATAKKHTAAQERTLPRRLCPGTYRP